MGVCVILKGKWIHALALLTLQKNAKNAVLDHFKTKYLKEGGRLTCIFILYLPYRQTTGFRISFWETYHKSTIL